MTRFLFVPFAAASLCAVLLSSACGAKPAANAADPSQVKVEEAPDVNVLEVPHPERYALSTVGRRPVVSELTANGSITFDVNRSVAVLSLAAGRAVEIHTRLGDHVEKGQLLLRIDSPDVAQAFSDYQHALADELLARKQFERSQLLLDKGAIAVKDMEVAQDAEDKAKVDVATSAQRIRILGADPAHVSPVIDVKAPASGFIVEQNVTAGTAVRSTDNSPNLFTIADLSSVWLVCDVFENNLAQVRVGDAAVIHLNAYPDKPLRGRIANIATVLDPATRSAKVRIDLPNPGGILRIGMFATATFRAQTAQLRAFVPATAILRLHDRDSVFVPIGGRQFRRVEVQAGAVSSDGMQDILAGLSPGDRVVTTALQFSAATSQ